MVRYRHNTNLGFRNLFRSKQLQPLRLRFPWQKAPYKLKAGLPCVCDCLNGQKQRCSSADR